MHLIEKVRGIILRTYPSGESDLVLRLITEEQGKISAIAKRTRATKRSGSATLDLFDCGVFELKSGRGTLRSVNHFSSDTPMHHLRDSLDTLTLAGVLCEATDLLLLEDGGNDERGFEITLAGLTALSPRTSLRENCAVLFRSLGELLGRSGFLDTQSLGRGSRDTLLALVSELERHTEKQLRSRESLITLLERLRS